MAFACIHNSTGPWCSKPAKQCNPMHCGAVMRVGSFCVSRSSIMIVRPSEVHACFQVGHEAWVHPSAASSERMPCLHCCGRHRPTGITNTHLSLKSLKQTTLVECCGSQTSTVLARKPDTGDCTIAKASALKRTAVTSSQHVVAPYHHVGMSRH